jgi:hypothetical protein
VGIGPNRSGVGGWDRVCWLFRVGGSGRRFCGFLGVGVSGCRIAILQPLKGVVE